MTELAATFRRSALDRYFKFAENGTTLARDTMAGVTTFIVMSYIIFVNPSILGFVGIEGLQDIKRRHGRALLPVHVLRPDHRDGSGPGDRRRPGPSAT